jgi:hypothetical protein
MALTFRLPSRHAFVAAAVIGCLSLGLFANLGAPAQARAPGQTLTKIDAVLTVNTDRTAMLEETRRIVVLHEGAIRAAGQQVATYIDEMETLDLLEAYTEKSDGRKIEVPPSRILRRDASVDDEGSYRVDQKALTAIYPDVALGDTIVFKTRMHIRSGSFPGHFVTQFLHSSEVKPNRLTFKVTIAEEPREIPDSGSRYRIVVPKGMAIQVGIFGDGLTKDVTEDETTITYTATFGERSEAGDNRQLSAVERGPRIFVSTLRDYEDLGQSYWAVAQPHMQVTPEIQAVADEITAGIEDRREQARAISLWVKRNISYIVVHRGIGRDLSTEPAWSVLRNRYGECKEHAILTTALLAARNIESELVLIQLGNISSLPETPTLAFFNHLIVHLPEFELFDDPTSPTTPFGQIAKEGRNKPVVIMSARGVRLGTTPVQN